MARFVSIILTIVIAAAPACAETLIVTSDPCPAAAEQPLIIDLGDVELFNEQPAASLGRVFVIYPPVREGWASARILMRFNLEATTAPEPAPECPRPRLFKVPR